MDRLRALRPSGEEGAFLVEVIVTAALLLTVSMGLLLAFDGAGAASAQARLRAQALTVAQSELDLLRTQRFNDLRALSRAPRTVTVAGREFTVTSTVAPVRQTNVPTGCNVRRSRDALEATVAVGWGTPREVRLSSVVSAPVGAGGGLLAIVKREGGAPVDGLAVTLTATGGGTATTDATGCARWDNVASGVPSTVTFAQTGWVDQQGQERVTRELTLAREVMNTTAFAYDQAGAVRLAFRTNRVDPQRGLVEVASQPPKVAFDNASVTPVVRAPAWGDAAVRTANATASGTVLGGLFPFATTKYAVFAGTCETALPPSGPHLPEVLVPRATTASAGGAAHVVRLPSLDVRVGSAGAAPPDGTKVEIRSCGAVFDRRDVLPDGTLADPGTPYGRVGLCATAPDGRQAWAELNATSFGTPPPTALELGTATCPA